MQLSSITSGSEQDFFRFFIRIGKLELVKRMLDDGIKPDQDTIDFVSTVGEDSDEYPFDQNENKHIQLIEMFQNHPLTSNLKCSQTEFESMCECGCIGIVKQLTRNGFCWERKPCMVDSAILDRNFEMVKLLHSFGLVCSNRCLEEIFLEANLCNGVDSEIIEYLYTKYHDFFNPKFMVNMCDQLSLNMINWLVKQDSELCDENVLKRAIKGGDCSLVRLCLKRLKKTQIIDKFISLMCNCNCYCGYDDSD
jgi:hypothetical protein